MKALIKTIYNFFLSDIALAALFLTATLVVIIGGLICIIF